MHCSDLSVPEMDAHLDDLSFLTSSLTGMKISASGNGETEEYPDETAEHQHHENQCGNQAGDSRGCKRRRVECKTESSLKPDGRASSPDLDDAMPSLVPLLPGFRGCAMRFFTVSMGSVQRTISGLTSSLSFLSSRRQLSSRATDSQGSVAELSTGDQPTDESRGNENCCLHRLMTLDVDIARAKDFNQICPLSISPFFGRGPLHLALARGASSAVVEDLLAFDPRATRLQDSDGMTPLHLGLKLKAPDEAAVLAVLSMDPEVTIVKDKFGNTPCTYGSIDPLPASFQY